MLGLILALSLSQTPQKSLPVPQAPVVKSLPVPSGQTMMEGYSYIYAGGQPFILRRHKHKQRVTYKMSNGMATYSYSGMSSGCPQVQMPAPVGFYMYQGSGCVNGVCPVTP